MIRRRRGSAVSERVMVFLRSARGARRNNYDDNQLCRFDLTVTKYKDRLIPYFLSLSSNDLLDLTFLLS